ncbi:sulfotransferase domain-containing protein [Roseobacteraceae bacterium S113]
MSKVQDKTFILGVGAQKAGTTWLHVQLSRQSYAEFGFLKEYHVFDALELPDYANAFCNTLVEQAKQLIDEHGPLAVRHEPDLWRRLSFLADPDCYFEYFSALLDKSPDAVLTGDITPSYALLSEDMLTTIRDGLIRNGFKVRVVYLMRDPVDRVWSSVRMTRRNQVLENPNKKFLMSEEEAILSRLESPWLLGPARYDKTVERIKSVFDKDELYFELYERLFTPESIERLATFLGVPKIDVNFSERVNASPSTQALSPEAIYSMATTMAPAYQCAKDVFGADEISTCWPSSLIERP